MKRKELVFICQFDIQSGLTILKYFGDHEHLFFFMGTGNLKTCSASKHLHFSRVLQCAISIEDIQIKSHQNTGDESIM